MTENMTENVTKAETDSLIPAALAMEGGSLRGLFSAGVLDVLMERGLYFSYVNGVSAGSMNALSYISRQPGRTAKVDFEYVHDKRFLSFRNLVKKREIFSFEFLFGELCRELVPFDFETFEHSGQTFEAVVTRCRTGKPEYLSRENCSDMMKAVQASSSLPVLSHMVKVDGKQYLDGGLSMPVAYRRAMDLGYDKVVVILTRHKGFRKSPMDKWTDRAYRRYFEPLPRLLDAIEAIPDRYNRMQEEMDRLEAEGKIYIIRPEQPVLVSRFERDKEKLQALYGEGRRVAESQLAGLCGYLGIDVPEADPKVVEQENRLLQRREPEGKGQKQTEML
ncbi:MAG: patatin family protein [Lachnospiraceae bacterium]|nr:patatin family protein [Lachnospiraceae bacterium]